MRNPHMKEETLHEQQIELYHAGCKRVNGIARYNRFFRVDESSFLSQWESMHKGSKKNPPGRAQPLFPDGNDPPYSYCFLLQSRPSVRSLCFHRAAAAHSECRLLHTLLQKHSGPAGFPEKYHNGQGLPRPAGSIGRQEQPPPAPWCNCPR
ncbi:MAG: hypothetical protein K0Q90_3319 [Paenibacillaceae bacterium]|nr:hypothetical protein [Paenibacillaceae bacterium]